LENHFSGNGVNQDLRNDMLRHTYGLKKEIDLSFLTGRELIQVAIGSFHVQLRFDEDVAVPVEAEFRYFDGQQEWVWQQEPSSPQIGARTVAMLGASIISVETNENGTLALTFSNGHRLTILDSFKEYESYELADPARPSSSSTNLSG
jgi:hypothetical protein